MTACVLPLALALAACGPPPRGRRGRPALPTDFGPAMLDPAVPGFRPEVRARLDAFLATHGRTAPGYDRAHPPVAVFDWDNTMMKNDIGDATMYHLLEHDGVRQPPDRDWLRTSPELTPAGAAALNAACDGAAPPGAPLPTSRRPRCMAEILAVFEDGQTTAHAPAFRRESTLTNHATYAWAASLLAGMTPEQVRSLGAEVYFDQTHQLVGATRELAGRTVDNYVRIYPAMADLVRALHAAGIDVWVVSASPQHIVEVAAEQAGVPDDHVIGVRNVTRADDTQDYALAPCGGDPHEPVITYNRGKRCWINRVIFGLPADAQLARASDPTHRPVFAAGDSDTDLAMLQDATGLKLVINRNRVQLMCNAYADYGQRWVVQPMFLAPLAQHAAPYACSTTTDVTGAPITDEAGHTIADQGDAVYAP